jgi:hypothetical protein
MSRNQLKTAFQLRIRRRRQIVKTMTNEVKESDAFFYLNGCRETGRPDKLVKKVAQNVARLICCLD